MDQQPEEDNLISNIAFKALKHDIKNQLSNIYLAIEQLKYELPEVTTDISFYLDMINTSCNNINSVLTNKE